MLSTRGLCQLTLTTVVALFPLVALAWNPRGHQEVGAVADHLIVGSHAQQWVEFLLHGRNLQTVSVWPDCARAVKSNDDGTFTYHDNPQHTDCVVFSDPQDVQRFESFVARNWKQCGTAHGTEYCHQQYHYADVSNLRDHYQIDYVGANDHDVVHAINAAIAVLRGQAPAAPFSIADKQEALILLTHYVGDLHQPLHAAALYLDANGQVIDPDISGYKLGNDTAGGNYILDNTKNLHSEWDAPPASPVDFNDQLTQLLSLAKQIHTTPGDIRNWPTAWATDSIQISHQAFAGLHFSMRPAASANVERMPEKWDVSGIDANYQARADAIKMQQLAKAGARLAQLLESIWPDDQALPPDAAK
jgi:hypothetical protein